MTYKERIKEIEKEFDVIIRMAGATEIDNHTRIDSLKNDAQKAVQKMVNLRVDAEDDYEYLSQWVGSDINNAKPILDA